MKGQILSIATFFIGVLILAGCATTPVYTSKEISNIEESPSPFVDQDSKILYWVQHDSKYLYLTLATSGPISQRQILMQGISVWLDQSGRKGNYLGFKYPAGDSPMQRDQPPMGRGDRQLKEEMGDQKEMSHMLIEQFQSRINYIELHGFLGDGSFERLNYRLEKGPVKVNITMNDGGELLYRARVPLQSIFTEDQGTNRLLGIGIEGGEMNHKGPGRLAPGGGGPAIRAGMPAGGGQGGPPGGGPDMESSPSIDFWFKVLI